MAKQRTFASLAWSTKGKVTRRERFLAEMDRVIPWPRLRALIEPHYPKAGRGRQPLGLEKMLRIYFVQQWFNLSDPQAEDALYDSESIRRVVGVELGDDVVPDETTLLRFRHLLERHQLSAAILRGDPGAPGGAAAAAEGGHHRGCHDHPRAQLDQERHPDPGSRDAPDPEGEAVVLRDEAPHWDRPPGVVHHVVATDAATADITQLPALLHGQERDLYGDQAYWKEDHRVHWRLAGGRYRVNRRGTTKRPLTEQQQAINRTRSRHRARGEHPFHVVKRLWGFTKVRYRGLAKNLTRAWTMFGLANLYLVRRHLLPPGWEPCLPWAPPQGPAATGWPPAGPRAGRGATRPRIHHVARPEITLRTPLCRASLEDSRPSVQKLLLGVGTNGWTKSEGGATLTVGTLTALMRFYPSATGGFFLTGGLGLGTVNAELRQRQRDRRGGAARAWIRLPSRPKRQPDSLLERVRDELLELGCECGAARAQRYGSLTAADSTVLRRPGRLWRSSRRRRCSGNMLMLGAPPGGAAREAR